MELHDQAEAPRHFVAAIVRGILSSPEAQKLLARVMLRVGQKYDDDAMRDAGERLAKVAKAKG